MKRRLLASACAALLMGIVQPGHAGPVIIDGTDANEHGSASGGANTGGWLYMQSALQNLASVVNPAAARVVVDLGTSTGTARSAIVSAFNLSPLSAAGWTLRHVDGAAAVGSWLDALSTANTGILYIPTRGNAGGDLDAAELAAINARASAINGYVGGLGGDPRLGGALFAMGESGAGAYGWLSSLVPGIVVTDVGGGGVGTDITLTATGVSAFPGLTNTALAGADPWHNYFSGNLGGLSALGVASQGGATRNIILGGGVSTVIGCGQPGQPPCNPDQPPPVDGSVPEPGALWLLAAGGLAAVRSRSRKPS